MTSELIRYQHRSPAVVLTLNRSDKRNALSRALIAELTEAFHRAADDPAVRCVILTGDGPVFCAGMDLEELQGTLHVDADVVWSDAIKLAELYDLIFTLPKPTIAAVNGHAVAGGAGLVTVCDLAIAVPAAKLGYPEVRRGLVAAMVMPHLLRHVGERTARYLLLTGELMDAHEALACGLLGRVVPAESLMENALKLAYSISEGGPSALATTKELLKRCSRQALTVAEFARAARSLAWGKNAARG